MRTALLLLSLLAAPAFAGAIWKWVDEKGVTHYSDQPVPGATKMDISTGNRWDSSRSTAPRASSQTSDEPPANAGPPYALLEITKPRQGENVINTGGKVPVEITTDPRVASDHKLRLFLDGRLVDGYENNAMTYELSDVTRGSHTVAVAVEDQEGTQLQQSIGRNFNVLQNSVAKPPVGPTLRPPPKPRN